ncbi:class I SAM-dependent methyltransferase [Arcobacter aquimarinus]|uniref:SAM-dependent methyltransferase n=1 Tax=Arcobacter aquimarinus TaxID=1315211 RepID=A0AAE7B366_9BACT|nr:class I SAM-dependent methyltransferase [Arcobacter aquimarinus]QKE24992.1 SAM-dependent methyltransferase [Arcobacter aquimarinus]RXI36767.1 SAM-dependent methyltransferase [Arcobacter aquimarinus]
MRKEFFKNNDNLNALDAQYEAQKIAFAPIIFQVARTMRDLKLLELLSKNKDGLTYLELANKSNLTKYAVQVLCETALSANIVSIKDEKVFLTKIGFFINSDRMTNANMNYNHHVNYLGLFNLEESIKNGKAEGLKVFGNWETIYPALSTLPEEVKNSWFEFDHLYSDSGFPKAIKILKNLKPKNILDIGGNTGKFATLFAKENPEINITIMDLPQQVKLAKQTIYENNITNVSTYEGNILLDETLVPKGFDIIWMSQFLDCFKEEQIVNILNKIRDSIDDNAEICIMEPFWDRQNNETASFCVINTSPYFTAMANGYSKMFKYTDFEKLLIESGLNVIETIDDIGLCQTIIRCKK